MEKHPAKAIYKCADCGTVLTTTIEDITAIVLVEPCSMCIAAANDDGYDEAANDWQAND